ncbi:MAG: type II/IV secretion system protein [Phycisphaeraceae bacterium]|nr:type II/IV secretion system protein [Phycisphaerae bacterium]MBX3391756.1 type II/IV secretion system protein [Phycisphaeraceae bacterium]
MTTFAQDRGDPLASAPPDRDPPLLEQVPDVDPAAIRTASADQAVRLRVVPYAFDRGVLLAAMIDPGDFAASDELSVTAGVPVRRVGATAEVFEQLLRGAYGITAAQMAARLAGQDEPSDDLSSNLESVEAADLHRMAEQPSLINLVNLIILEAIRARASDIHVEPFEKSLCVKYRVDGVLVSRDSPPRHLQPAITSRIKIMAGMNIAERYAPQDGHITLRFEGRKIDIRVSTVPTIYGESVVMRILDKESIRLDLETLGMRATDRDVMARWIDLPHGMILVTGPTGSGKTTTLYAALTKLYDPRLKIITIEDPVEYELGGVNQIPVNPKRGLSFASGLRSILRQDPDVIMVGEIRDAETAEISVRAALTGHLLFSTLHTNNALSAVGRLLDMGIEPFLLSSVLEGIMAQRLGRRLCPHCRARAPLNEASRHRLASVEAAMFPDGLGFDAAGCERCDGAGFRGRVGFYEMAPMTSELRRAVSERATTQQLSRIIGPSYVTMRRDGIIKASQGHTTVDEVLQATQDAEEIPAV